MDFSIISERPSQLPQASQTLQFILAENGSLDEYPLAEFVSPLSPKNSNTLMDFIEKEYRIPQADQVILRSGDGKQLENSVNLREFFDKDQTIHVFNTKFCGEAAISDDFEVICPNNSGKNDWSEVAFDSLPEIYENYLSSGGEGDMDSGKCAKLNELITIFCDVKSEISSLKEASVKLQRQKESESVVKKNLMGYYNDKKKKFDETFSQMKMKILNFQTLLTDFDANLEILSKEKVDAQLGDNKTYLIDYFDVAKAQSNKAIYEKNQAKIMAKCQEMENEIFEYNEQLTGIEENIPNHYLEIIALIEEQEADLMKIHDKNLQGIYSINGKKTGTINMPNMSSREWETVIPKLREIFQKLQQIRTKLEGYLKDNAIRLGNFVSDVANIQLIIQGKLYNKHTIFRSLVEKHEKDIFNLEAIVQFPFTYQASIDEIQRRYMAKRECLTILNILENFINSENKQREEFSKNYSAYLPKTFCPILSKAFPHINFDFLFKIVDQDGSFCIKEDPPSLSKMNESGEVVKLLKSFSASAQAKEMRIQELEDTLLMQQEEIKRLREQSKFKNLGTNDFNRLVGSVNVQEKFDTMMKGLTDKCEGQLANLSGRLNSLKTQGLQSFEGIIQEIRHEVECESQGDSKKSVVELIREMKQKSVNSIDKLNKVLEIKNMEKEEVMICLDDMQKKLEEAIIDREHLNREKAELEDMVENLNRKVYMMEKVEDSLEEELFDMQQDLDSNQEVISSLNTNLRNKEQEVGLLTEKVEYLSKITEEKDKVIQECREQILILWEKLAEKDSELRDIHALFSKASEEAQLVRDQNDKLEGLLAKKEELVASVQERNDKLEDLLAKKEEVMASVQEKLKDKQAKIKMLKRRMAEKDEELKIAEDNLCMCQEEIRLMSQQNFQLESDYQVVCEQNTELTIQKENLMSNNKIMEESLLKFESVNQENLAYLSEREEEIERLKREREDLMEEIQDLVGNNNHLGEVNQEILASLSEKEGEIERLRREREALMEEIQDLERDNSHFEASLSAKEWEIDRLKHEREVLMEEIQDLEIKKNKLGEVIRDDVAQEFTLRIEQLEDCINEKDLQIKSLQEMLESAQRDLENEKMKEKTSHWGMEEEECQIEESRRIDWGPSKETLGEVALAYYTTLLGGYVKEKMNTNAECPLEVLNSIPGLLGKLSIKLQDLKCGDKVLGFKFPGLTHYQLIQLDDLSANIPTMYYVAREDYGEFIIGTIDDLGYTKSVQDTRRQYRKSGGSSAIQFVQLAEVKGICLSDL